MLDLDRLYHTLVITFFLIIHSMNIDLKWCIYKYQPLYKLTIIMENV